MTSLDMYAMVLQFQRLAHALGRNSGSGHGNSDAGEVLGIITIEVCQHLDMGR